MHRLNKLIWAIVFFLFFLSSQVAAISPQDLQTLNGNSDYYWANECSNISTTSTGPVSRSDNEQTAFLYFYNKGLSTTQTAGLLGNLYAESSLNPAATEDGKNETIPIPGSGFGIAQWTTAGRQQGLVKLAQQEGFQATNLGVQLNYVWQELTTSYQSTLTALQQISSGDFSEATNIIMRQYEVPEVLLTGSPAAIQNELNTRINYATQIWSLYAALASTNAPTSSAATTTSSTSSSCTTVGSTGGIGGTVTGCNFSNTGGANNDLFTTNTSIVFPNVATMCARAQQLADPSSQLFLANCSHDNCEDMCDFVAGLAWGYLNSGYSDALDHWDTMKASGYAHPGDRNPPVGALLFYNDIYSSPDPGHIVVYLGNNMVLSSDISGPGTVSIVPAIAIEKTVWKEPYLGWSNPIFAGSKDPSF